MFLKNYIGECCTYFNNTLVTGWADRSCFYSNQTNNQLINQSSYEDNTRANSSRNCNNVTRV